MTDSDPTYNEQAEMSVVGSIIMSKGACISEVLQHMRSDMFFKPANQSIMEVALQLWSNQQPIDETTILSELQRLGLLKRVGGGPYLLSCVEATPTAANVGYYANIVKETFKLRQLASLCDRGKQIVFEGGGDYEEVVAQFERFLDDSDLTVKPDLTGFGDLFDEWQQWQDDPLDAMVTPWPRLNDYLAGGHHRQRLYIYAARPGCGKSVTLLNCAIQMAMAGHKGIIFSLEMPRLEVMSRLLAAGARADYKQITEHKMTRETFDSVNRFQRMNPEFNSRLMIDDASDRTMEQIASICRAQKRRGLDFVMIDYVQLLSSDGKFESRYRELGEMSKQAKILSRKLDVAVIMAAQLNRDVEKQSRLPQLTDLRESGNLEADADAVIMLSRGSDEDVQLPLIKMSVVKNRTGQDHVSVDLAEHFEWQRIGE